MGLSKFRGRAMDVPNGFIRSPGLRQPMKHSLQFGPRGMRPRFPMPPPGMMSQPPVFRPPGFLPPPVHAGIPYRPPFPPPFSPPPFSPPPYMPPMPPMAPAFRGRPGQGGFVRMPARGGKRGAFSQRGGRGRMKVKKTNLNTGIEVEAEDDKPWISEAIKTEIVKMKELLEAAKKSNSEADWQKYREHKEKVSVIVNEAKLEFIGSHPEEARAHYCETCDRDLKDAERLALHLAEHTVCGRDGCTFQAHPKVVDNHVRMQHRTGLYRRICVADSPEDIAKWIQERKNRFPTKENIARREAERREQMNRGERLQQEPESFTSYARGRNMRRPGRGMQFRGRGQPWRFRPRPGPGPEDGCRGSEMEGWKAQVAEEEKAMRRGRLVPFPGTGAFPDDGEDQDTGPREEGFSDTEWEGSHSALTQVKPLVASKVLMSLIGAYASDQSDDEGGGRGGARRAPPSVPPTAGVGHSDTVPAASQAPEGTGAPEDSDSAPEEAPIVFEKHQDRPVLPATDGKASTAPPAAGEKEPPAQPSTDGKESPVPPPAADEPPHSRRRQRHRGRAARWKDGKDAPEAVGDEKPRRPVPARPWYPPRRRPTLLDKLLKEEIRHERNVILQCVNHVVKNSFFDGHSASNAADLATCSSPDKRVQLLIKCISHVVHSGLLNMDDSANIDKGIVTSS
ncbi:uncharacterized protein LOC134534948 [Bacillus rossius redtenbacheri]|uniref:uncharacterized protein LOC134534948 n=1 Tax=Bacillus rossius redtenbacheri TaxID=93214 RepID=UPI002FDF0801